MRANMMAVLLAGSAPAGARRIDPGDRTTLPGAPGRETDIGVNDAKLQVGG